MRFKFLVLSLLLISTSLFSQEKLGSVNTAWKLFGSDKLTMYVIDDPIVKGISCYYMAPEKGGISGAIGLAEESSDVSISCRQVDKVSFLSKFENNTNMMQKSRSVFFKKLQIVRSCDQKRNVMTYLVYTDKLIDGSPKNSISVVPLTDAGVNCKDYVS